MPEQSAAARPPGQGQPRQEERSMFNFSYIMRMVGMWLVIQFAINQFISWKNGPAQSTTGATIPSNFDFNQRPDISQIANYSEVPINIAPIWPADAALDLKVYLSPALTLPPLKTVPEDILLMDAKNFKIGDFKDTREVSRTITIPPEVQANQTLWAHIFMGLTGSQLDPLESGYDVHKAIHQVKKLNHYLPKKKVRKLKNLLDKSEETELEPEPEIKGQQIGSFYHPNFTLAVVPGTGIYNWLSMHPAVRANVVLDPTGARDITGQNAWYYPVLFLNTFWQLRSHMTELNDTVTEMPLNLQLYNMASWKYSIMAAMDEGMKQNAQQAAQGNNPLGGGGGDGSEMEKFKEILLDTNPYLLGTTVFVSILHMIFEGLAFKNDISHWRTKKDQIGTSFRTIVANVIMQLIIFLYLVDNSEGTSWMILASQGFGVVLEAWKITKTADVRVRPPGPDSKFWFLPFVIVFEDKYKLSETEKKTQEYDQIAFRYLYVVAVPLLGAYAVYSVIYETHKSWYSYVIETLVGSVYAYGFLMMVPSLYINYRLKSVAHMPSKAMTYKFLNTFIDDLFAFTVRMPTLHRLATLRDDVIFFVYIYQKWKYRVDYSRVNEFGQGGESDDEADKEGGDEVKKILDEKDPVGGQDTKELKPSALSASANSDVNPTATATATGAAKGQGAKKRK